MCGSGSLSLSLLDWSVSNLLSSDIHPPTISFTDTGSIFSYGQGSEGQLGLGEGVTIVSQLTPIPFFEDKFVVNISSNYTQSAAITGSELSQYHSFALLPTHRGRKTLLLGHWKINVLYSTMSRCTIRSKSVQVFSREISYDRFGLEG